MDLITSQKTIFIKAWKCSECNHLSGVHEHCRNSHTIEISLEIPKISSGKYYTEYFEENGSVVNSAKIKDEIKKIAYDSLHDNGQKVWELTPVKNLLDSIEKIRSYFRENQYHDANCEFAIGTSCNCWCGEKYHGLKGEGAEMRDKK
jgi:hypothetical protein